MMATTEAFTVRTEPDIIHQLDHMADSLGRSRNYIVNQALKEYLQHHAWQIEKITRGIETADRGELVNHDDMMQELEDLIEEKAKSQA
jgi:predicted transcriptional regulator